MKFTINGETIDLDPSAIYEFQAGETILLKNGVLLTVPKFSYTTVLDLLRMGREL
jgi:hypothetical protein